MSKTTIGQEFRKLCQFIPFSIALSGISVLSYQITILMKYGCWKSLDARLFLNLVLPSNFLLWLNDSKSWIGLKNVIFSLFNWPLALFLFLSGWIILLLVIQAFELCSKIGRINRMPIEVIPPKNWRNT